MRGGCIRAIPATLQESPSGSHMGIVALDFPAWWASPAGISAAIGLAFAGGCMAGSFLNVVAHRVPLGETVVFGRSHCPACGAMIRARHNVPVLGWLALRGRCRDCAAPISRRYPLVEAGCGCLVAALAAVEVAAAPGGDPRVAVATWLGRAAVALTLVAWALLAQRGHVVSIGTAGIATSAALLAATLVPDLRPMTAWCSAAAWVSTAAWPGCLVASLTGIVMGWLGGVGRPSQAACGLVGAALGWQAAALAVCMAGGCRRVWRHPAAGPLGALAALVCWHPLALAWQAACRGFAAG